MSKVTLQDIISGYKASENLNENNAALEAAVENTLSRDGTSPNQMEALLDMNSYRIINLPDAVSNQEPITLSQAGEIAGVTNPLTQETVAAVLNPPTSAEISAGVTVVSAQYRPGYMRRYWTSGDIESAVEAACASNKRVVIDGDGSTTYTLAGTITVSQDDVVIDIQAGVTISHTNGDNNAFLFSGARCSLRGPGRILSVDNNFDAPATPPDRAVVWITGQDFTADSVVLFNVPRAGFWFADANHGAVLNCRIDGNFPYASYGGVNTGHYAIGMNGAPTSTVADDASWRVEGNLIKECVQGTFIGNTGSNASEMGINISGNTYVRCWDHGVYGGLNEGVAVVGNVFVSCNKPIVTDGIASVVSGNTLYSTEPTQTNGQQGIQIREAQGCIVTGNTLYGLAASIYVGCVDDGIADTVRDCIVSDNVLIRTGAGNETSAIRLGFFTEVCENNTIENNTIYGGGYTDENVGVIQLEMKATFTGANNTVRNNTIYATSVVNGIQVQNHNGTRITGNHISNSVNAGSAKTVRMIWAATSCLNTEIADNTMVWESGGTNVSVRGVQIDGTSTGSRVVDNKFRLTSGSLTASDPLTFVGPYFTTGNTGVPELATTAIDGFAYVPSCNGTPTGTPTAYTGLLPIVINRSANKLYFYSGGAWRDAGP